MEMAIFRTFRRLAKKKFFTEGPATLVRKIFCCIMKTLIGGGPAAQRLGPLPPLQERMRPKEVPKDWRDLGQQPRRSLGSAGQERQHKEGEGPHPPRRKEL